MLKRKLTLVEKIIVIGVVSFGLFIIGFAYWMKRTDKNFYLPQHYAGWVKIYYAVPGAAPLAIKDGALQIKVPASGILETSTPFEDGWSKDQFFRYDSTEKVISIPRSIEENGKTKKWMHWYESHFRNFAHLIPLIPLGKDTLLYEGTRIYKTDAKNVQYIEGKKSLEAFYISENAEELNFNPPALPDSLIFTPKLKKLLTK